MGAPMARIRTIKPEFWTHEDLSSEPEATHMLAAALLNHSDDEGYFQANPGLVKAACCPLREPSVSIHDSLIRLQKCGYIRLGVGKDGKRYGQVVKFDEHQRVNRPTPSKIKALGVAWEDSVTTHTQLTEDSPPERNREQGREGKEESSLRSESSSPKASDSQSGKNVHQHPATERLMTAVLDAYHEILPNCQHVAVLNPKRRKRITAADKLARQVCKQQGWAYEPAVFWTAYFRQCSADPWMRGEVTNPRNPSWKQNLDVLLAEDRFAGIMDRAIAALQKDAA